MGEFSKMKILFFSLLFSATIALKTYTEKLQYYQNITNISDEEVDKIYTIAMKNLKMLREEIKGQPMKPKFRYLQKSHMDRTTTSYVKVPFATREINVDSQMSSGSFICTVPGVYHFNTALDTGTIRIEIIFNKHYSYLNICCQQ